jgi:hypothetical protein
MTPGRVEGKIKVWILFGCWFSMRWRMDRKKTRGGGDGKRLVVIEAVAPVYDAGVI